MTNPNLTHLAFVLDRSGSMGHAGKAVEATNGVARLLAEQVQLPGELHVTIARFDDEYELVASAIDGNDVTGSMLTIEPRGMTALYDAIGATIVRLGKSLASQDEAERPGKVVVIIATDGEENSSRQWNRKRLRELITEHQAKWSWEFVFIGTSEDQMLAAVDLGMSHDSVIATADSGGGYGVAYAAASSALTRSRIGGQSVAFTDADRQRAKNAH